MTTTPWWTTIAAALAGGALTLFATAITTIATNHYASRRLKIELIHRRYLEREKALYDSRLAAYTELIRLMYELNDLVPKLQGRAFDRESSRQTEEADQAIHVVKPFMKFEHLLPVISGEQVVDAFVDFVRECDRLPKVTAAAVRFPAAEASIWGRLAAEMGNLIVAIRREIGSDLDEGMSAARTSKLRRYRAMSGS